MEDNGNYVKGILLALAIHCISFIGFENFVFQVLLIVFSIGLGLFFVHKEKPKLGWSFILTTITFYMVCFIILIQFVSNHHV